MRSANLGMLAALVASVTAFQDTSPFFMWSTAAFKDNVDVQLRSKQEVTDTVKQFLSTCPTDVYMILEDQEVSAIDFSGSDTPGLKQAIASDKVRGKMSVAEVVDGTDAKDIAKYITSICGGQVIEDDAFPLSCDAWEATHIKKSSVVMVQNGPFGSRMNAAERADTMHENDLRLSRCLKDAPESYTVIYTTTPHRGSSLHDQPYEPSFEAQGPLHVEMKRQHNYIRESNSTISGKAPLFEKYQFFTPGLFMAILISLLLLSILGVAINAVSSLSVSYGAFDKEMGPAAQRKQQ